MCLSATRFGLPNPSQHHPLPLRRRFAFHREFHPERVQNHRETAEDRVATLGQHRVQILAIQLCLWRSARHSQRCGHITQREQKDRRQVIFL